jgi:hypothetical protein
MLCGRGRAAFVSQLSYIADSRFIKRRALEMSATATRRMAVGCHRARHSFTPWLQTGGRRWYQQTEPKDTAWNAREW